MKPLLVAATPETPTTASKRTDLMQKQDSNLGEIVYIRDTDNYDYGTTRFSYIPDSFYAEIIRLYKNEGEKKITTGVSEHIIHFMKS